MAEEELKKTEDGQAGMADGPVEVAPKSGRDVFLERYRGYHPDLEGDPTDDDMWGFAGAGLSERDELKDKYDKLNGANETLALVVQEEPSVAQFVSMIASGENPIYAIGKSFGNLIEKLDEEALEKYRAGQEEHKARYNTMKENFKTYENTLKAYAEKNQLTPENMSEINNAILDIAEALNEGNIPEEVIDNVWKGIDSENATTQAAEVKAAELSAAELAGRNKAIDEVKSKKASPSPLPDLGGSKTNKQAMPKPPMETRMRTLAESVVDKE